MVPFRGGGDAFFLFSIREEREKTLIWMNENITEKISPSFTVEWHGRKVGLWVREWNENDGINVKSPHYIDGFYSHSFFCFAGTDNSTVTTISIFGWEHILIETRRASGKKRSSRENEKIHSIGNKGKYKNYLILKL